jgi:hypothetical protein
VNTKTAGSVGARSDHAPLVGSPADGEGLTPQAGIALFFDGTEEGIQIKVQDFAGHPPGSVSDCFVY